MSRHKLVKTLDLNNELDDYDGGEDYSYDEDGGGVGENELSLSDREQLQDGTVKVRSILGPGVDVTDQSIQESLWHYYYDVEKTVNYLLNQKFNAQSKTSKNTVKKHQGLDITPIKSPACSQNFSAQEFFKDCAWFNIPLERRAEITIEPLYPRGGLLGGSNQGSSRGPKVSKLAALATARRKENEQAAADDSKSVSNSIALLDKLSLRTNANNKSSGLLRESLLRVHPPKPLQDQSPSSAGLRKYPTRRRKSVTPPPKPETEAEVLVPAEPSPVEEAPILTAPSSFAQTILGSLPGVQVHTARELSAFAGYPIPDNTSLRKLTESDPFAGPSPDDIISNAQSTSKGMKAPKVAVGKSSGKEKAVNGITNSLGKVTIDDSPRVKSKNLDVVAEYSKKERKNAASFVVIGHVDAGKSSLMGRLLYDLQVVDQRTLDRYRKEAESIGKSSFALAWVLDQGSEERMRGVTIDIAMNKFETERTAFTILDAPGHKDFIPNMIAGTAQADFAVLVVDASIGSFESGLRGQTKEHALLVRSMGVQRVIIAVNKMDTVSWSKGRFDEIQQQISAFLTAAGFQSKNIAFVPCSGLTGDNITRRSTEPAGGWYEGPILLDELESSEPVARALNGPLRLPIADIFRGAVQNPLSVSGRLESGSVQVADKLIAVPSNEGAFVKGIEVDGESADYAVAGQNVTIHLNDIDPVHLRPGDVLCSPEHTIKSPRDFSVKVLAFEHLTPMTIDVHRGRLHVSARIGELKAILDKATGTVLKKKPKLVRPGEVAMIKVMIDGETGIPVESGSRVVLRAGGETVAAGLVQ